MEREYNKISCPLYNSEYCKLLNMESCDKCTIKVDTPQEAESVKADLDGLNALMPDGGIGDLFSGDECLLCKGEKKNKRDFYALTDLGNREPKHNAPSFMGLRLKSGAGSVIPIQISCCKECRKRFLLIEYLPGIIGTGVAALMLILMSIRPIREPIAAVAAILPFVLFTVVSILGIVAGFVLRAFEVKKYSQVTHLDIMEIPKLSEMSKKGWFEIYEKKGCSKLIFSKKGRKHGVYTAKENEEKVEVE